MITDHVWRPAWIWFAGRRTQSVPCVERPCSFMNCRQPRDVHERSVSLAQVKTR